jgi:tetratricopeptide (TPR) repeat protein
LGAPHAILAAAAGQRLDFRREFSEIRHALALSPDDPEVLTNACRTIACLGNGEEGLRLADRFLAVDPLHPLAYQRKAEILKLLRRYSQAIEVGRRELELGPNLYVVRIFIGDSLTLLGRHAEALVEYAAMPPDELFRLTGEALVAARTRDRGGAERTLARAKQLFGASASYQYAEVYAQMGDKDQAFVELDNAVKAKDSGLVYLKTDPFLDPIRHDPRFAAFLRRLDFPV